MLNIVVFNIFFYYKKRQNEKYKHLYKYIINIIFNFLRFKNNQYDNKVANKYVERRSY